MAWIDWLRPHFAGNGSLYFTGTYSDDYGLANGLMLPRNVARDVRRFLTDAGYGERRHIIGIERHAWRDILHWHGIIEGDFTEADTALVKAVWSLSRGFCRVLPVLDGCESYVTKYALKGDTECFEFTL
jgi:hypothetical protein